MCGEDGLKLELPRRDCLIEATYLSCGRYEILPAAVTFRPDAEPPDCSPLEVTKYSDDVFALEFQPRFHGLNGFFEPVSQISYKQGGLYHTATLLHDGIYYIELENSECLFKKMIGAELENVRLSAENMGENALFALHGELRGKKRCLFIGYDDDYKVLIDDFIDGAAIENGHLVIKKDHVNMLRHSEEAKYSFDGKKLSLAEKKISPQKNLLKKEKLLPWYFLECVAAGDFETAISLLSKENYDVIEAAQLKNFFGEFDLILQNVYDERYAHCVGVRERVSPCFNKVSYYDFSIKDGHIDNIISVR